MTADDRHVHPLTAEEHAEVIFAVQVMISALPEGDDERGVARARLVEALAKLEAHWCAWCPVEVRDLYANAYNAFVNYGSGRERKKMGDLQRCLTSREPEVEQHFRDTNEWNAKQPLCARLPGCQIRPAGRFHDAECPVEKGRS